LKKELEEKVKSIDEITLALKNERETIKEPTV
jgi:hypothetical protein